MSQRQKILIVVSVSLFVIAAVLVVAMPDWFLVSCHWVDNALSIACEWLCDDKRKYILLLYALLGIWLVGLLRRWKWACEWTRNGKMWIFDTCSEETRRRIQIGLLILALVGCTLIAVAAPPRTYITYSSDRERPHSLILADSTLTLHFVQLGLIPPLDFVFAVETLNDSTLHLSRLYRPEGQTGVPVSNEIVEQLDGSTLTVDSGRNILRTSAGRIYVSKSYSLK